MTSVFSKTTTSRARKLVLGVAAATGVALGSLSISAPASAGYITTVCNPICWPVYVPTCNPYLGICG